MVLSDIIQRYPLLRLLISYIIGVVVADALYPYAGDWWLYCLGLCVASLLLLIVCGAKRGVALASGVLSLLFFVSLGAVGYGLSRQHACFAWPPHKMVYVARVLDAPQQRERSMLCAIRVEAVDDAASWQRVNRKVLAYMEPTAAVGSLQVGDAICFRGKVMPPRNFAEDRDFDYARYVVMQGAAGTVYLPERDWVKVAGGMLSVRERMMRFRDTLQEKYMRPLFDDEAFGVLSALTLGDKSSLDKAVRDAYTNAGAAHVLALSGMHVGVIYGMLSFVLHGLFRRRGMRWLRELVTIAVLWLFALMVGMSASVVRAVTMCTLYVVARWVADDTSSSLHVLSLTALLMLLVQPLYVFDVGFQLSFTAMLSILWLGPYMEIFYRRYDLCPVLTYFFGIVSISLVAQIGVLPLLLHHFGTFPSYFMVTNLVVVPLLSVVLLLALVWWALLLTGIPLAHPLAVLLHDVICWTNDALANIAQWPGAVIRVDEFGVWKVFFSYLFVLFAGLFVIKKWHRGAVLALASMLFLLMTFLF